jgi:nucleoside-diphosphate-sugar epimerase
MRVLIIGGCGYIGSALYEKLWTRHHVESVDLEWFGNFTHPSRKAINQRIDYGTLSRHHLQPYDAVIVAAAHSSVAMCQGDPYGAYQNNVHNFVRLLSKLKKQKLIYMSSSCVYNGSDWGIEESALTQVPSDHLTLTKTTIDRYAALSDIEFYGCLLGSVAGYAPNLRADLMVNAMTLSALNHGHVNVSNGEYRRPILGMSDLVRAVDAILDGRDQRGFYNLASFSARIDDIGQGVAQHLDAKLIARPSAPSYNFSMTSGKFANAYDFTFEARLDSIVDSIVNHRHDLNPTMRDAAPEYLID